MEKCRMNDYELLKWDSDFFGVIVARILPERLTEPDLKQLIAKLKDRRVGLAYWASCPEDISSQNAARNLNGFLADKKVTYAIDITGKSIDTDSGAYSIEEYADNVPTSELESLAIQAGVYSRFNLDPRIPEERFEMLYKLWIRNSVSRKIADAVLVVRYLNRIVGMVTVGEKNHRADIGLIAVDDSMRGKNLGVSLVRAAQKWAVCKGYASAQVVTQGENLAACKLYEKCGYFLEKTENVYHFWI
jgi:dTDP-4-amino-4,6-dideoxy-D-galactose acyltransferase